MKKLIFISLTICLIFAPGLKLIAQDSVSEPIKNQYKFGIGGGAGFCTGYGLSFRYIPKKFGGQINFAPYIDKVTSRYSTGLSFIYMFTQDKVANLFLYQANHYYYNSQLTTIFNPDFPFEEKQEWVTESYLNSGLGFGIEIVFAKRIGLNLMAGYAFYKNFTQLNVTGEAALYYKF